MLVELIISALLGLFVGAVVTYFFNKKVNDSKVTGAKNRQNKSSKRRSVKRRLLKKRHY